MGSEYLVTNVVLYLITLVYCLKKYGFSNVTFLWFVYALTAVLCWINYNTSSLNTWHITFSPLLFIYINLFLLFYPISNITITQDKIEMGNLNLYKKVAILYMFLSLYSTFVYLPDAIDAIQNPDWMELYTESKEKHERTIFSLIANAFFHIRYLGIALFFYMCSLGKSNRLFLIVLGICSFLPIAIVSLLHGSRGGMVVLMATLIIAYLFFKNILPKSIKKSMKMLFLVMFSFAALFIILVSVSRFDDTANEMSLYYLGHSMLYFDDSIFGCLKNHSYGGYMLNFGDVSRMEAPYTSFFGVPASNTFHTIVGVLYLDFGAIGTLLFSFLVCVLLVNKTKKRRFELPDMFLFITYMSFLFSGLFVFDKGYGMLWVETIIVYGFLKFIQHTKHTSVKSFNKTVFYEKNRNRNY